jgi:phenylacetate-CoA ligase
MSNLEDSIYQIMPHAGRAVLMNLHGLRIRQHRYGRRFTEFLNRFERLAYASADEREADQRLRLSLILRNARSGSSHYRKLLEHFSDDDLSPLRAIESLRLLPLLTKQDVRDGLRELMAGPPKRGWLHGHTSGTTGSPLGVWYDRDLCYATNAADRLQKRIVGIDDREFVGLLLGRQVVPKSANRPPYWVVNRIQRQVWYSSLHMSEGTIPTYVEDIRKRGLQVLEGYPSTLYLLARHLIKNGERLPLKATFTSSETLHPVQRDAIQEAFSAPNYDYYGHAERTIFAIECKAHGGKHLVEPFGYTEVVDSAGSPVEKDTEGFLVGTSLLNNATFMIRYLTSDRSAIMSAPCDCGVQFPRIMSVATKAEDTVVLPSGRLLSPSALTHPFKPFHEIRKSQIIQEQIDKFSILLVAGENFDEQSESELLMRLTDRLGKDVRITITRVEDIPAEKSGKFRWVVSKVPNPYRMNWT